MTVLSPSVLKEKFSRFARRQRLKLTPVRFRFLGAASDGDIKTVGDILDAFPEAVGWTRGQSPIEGIWSDVTPLLNALWNRNKNLSPVLMINFLIDHGADPNGCSSYGYTALHKAVQMDDKESIAALIHRGANADQPDNEGVSPRQLAQKLANTEDWRAGEKISREDLRPFIDDVINRVHEANVVSCTAGTVKAVATMHPLRLKRR